MFYCFRPEQNGKDKYGRTSKEALRDHARWCLNTMKNNPPDNEALKNPWEQSPSWLVRPTKEFMEYFAGDIAFNAYTEIRSHLDSFSEFYTTEEMAWINSWMHR